MIFCGEKIVDIVSIIEKKKLGLELNKDEITFFVDGILSKKIEDYQISALLMAICFKGMTENETYDLTIAMRDSGEIVDFLHIEGVTVDKHSTGGVGDSVTFVIAPLLASLGLKFAKMSGRGLGFTGGTLDKLESIEGMNVNLSKADFEKQVSEIGVAICGQTANICPADKILYALRDVTATVDSIPLIASSIMSKKLAVCADCLVLDVKVGDGSFLGDYEKTKQLAKLMVKIGKMNGAKIEAIITSMDEPLDNYIGNSLEIQGAVDVLKGEKNNLYVVSKAISVELLKMALDVTEAGAEKMIEDAIQSGKAFEKFEELVFAQGGKSLQMQMAKMSKVEIFSSKSGYISKIQTKNLGKLVAKMGGGRLKKEDKIDHSIGIKILKRVGDKVNVGDALYLAYANEEWQMEIAKQVVDLFEFSETKPKRNKLIYEVIE